MREIKEGGTYRHFKGHIYKVIAIAYDSETFSKDNPDASKKVVYQNIENSETWVRPYDMFNSLVDFEKYPNAKQKYRFEEIREEDR